MFLKLEAEFFTSAFIFPGLGVASAFVFPCYASHGWFVSEVIFHSLQ